jgi:RNA polymerase sigma-70 factor (ECF subfamily)
MWASTFVNVISIEVIVGSGASASRTLSVPEPLSLEPLPPHPALTSDTPGPEEATLDAERSAAVQTLLEDLSPDYRVAVVLRYWYDYSYAEIAEMLGTTESAIKSRLVRARQALAQQLEDRTLSALNPALEGS